MSKPTLDRPFARDILNKARIIAGKYHVVIRTTGHGSCVGTSLELPGVMGDGTTPTDCFKSVRSAMVAAVAYTLEIGKKPPKPKNIL